ncbi:putative F-box protein At3g17490 [Trifolium pratense]|uniref:putative F-box protein At3g17490 n=1 Tax=Trifolium pratense TaxID=57577 RepID=UPI001E695A2B|nr:putative F-box protein At3g17490 [Trifolium pratense]
MTDSDSDDDDDNYNSFWEIYSLSSNRWRIIHVNMPLFSRNKAVYMDGVSHWWDKNETHTYLVSFEFSNESFTKTPMPSFEVNNDLVILRDLVILNGSIAFILNYKKASTIHISILGELGVNESWTKLFVVGPAPSLNYPIVVAKKGKILFRSRHNRQNKQELVCICQIKKLLHNVELLGLTRVGSHQVIRQISAGFMIFFNTLDKAISVS